MTDLSFAIMRKPPSTGISLRLAIQEKGVQLENANAKHGPHISSACGLAQSSPN